MDVVLLCAVLTSRHIEKELGGGVTYRRVTYSRRLTKREGETD